MLAFASLEKIGFKIDEIQVYENFKFQCCNITKNESYISIINEYDENGHVEKQIIELNDRKLLGNEPTIETLKKVIDIL